VAAAEHLPPYMLAKTVIVRGPDGYAMAVLPADCKVDLEQLASTLNSKHFRLATEEEVRELFPECEVGAMPPFGSSFGLLVYLDIRLAAEPYILFNAGTHRDAIHMRVEDYIRLIDPTIAQFAHQDRLLETTTRS
jgi:Ala-tRNA(Pro) deacylase